MNAQELTAANAELRERVGRLRSEMDDLHARLRGAELELAESRRDGTALRVQLDHLAKSVDAWSVRAWSLVPIFVGAILSLSAGLIVALVKR